MFFMIGLRMRENVKSTRSSAIFDESTHSRGSSLQAVKPAL